MWQKLFSGPWPEAENLLPPPVQQQAARQIRSYWLTRGWQLVLGEVVLWAVITYQELPHGPIYGVLAALIGLAYVLGLFKDYVFAWLLGSLALFLSQGMLISGLGAVTALSFLMPYTFAGMLLTGRKRIFVQTCCMIAFWTGLIYEAFPTFSQLTPPRYIVVSYNILLAAFTFQTLRFLNHLAVEVNTAHVADEVQKRSQRFLARVSHELRTPLNSVIGFAKLLHRTDLPETQSRYLDQIIDEGNQLNRLVSDLLDSAHLATGELTLNLEECDLNTLCRAVADEHRPNLPSSVTLELALSPDLPSLQVDQLRLRQAVGNLMSNAVKYTPQGTITLRTYCRGKSLFVEIKDTGRGIPESQQQIVFVPFVQLDSRRIGVGLGLDISRQLVRLHGGEIHLESVPGQGSTFTIELPHSTPRTSDVQTN